jgi:hypothetical protein
MRDVFTFGLLSSSSEPKEQQAIEHPETVQGLIKEITNVMELYLFSWRTSRMFREKVEFSNLGVKMYRFDKFKEFNKKLSDTLEKFDLSQKAIKPQIISVIKPLTYQFYGEMMDAYLKIWIKECSKSYLEKPKGLIFDFVIMFFFFKL